MSNQQSIAQFFSTKNFQIPKYQRSYAWERQNIRDLFEDIQEALTTNSNHYVGTVVLAKTKENRVFNIVDGQQRLTTIVMFISVIISRLKDLADRAYYKKYYIESNGTYKLLPLERDRAFYIEIMNANITSLPQSKSQRHMLDAHDEMNNILDTQVHDPMKLLEAIGALNILEFIEEHESDAIRIFQTVNDRGRDLSKMDKMKSLVFYFSNKYLEDKYENVINNRFGEIFELYDTIKMIGEEQKINAINSKQFNEDDLLRHHHVCFSEDSYDPTSQHVLESVKFFLIGLRKLKDFSAMDAYIERYTKSLLDYVAAFSKLLRKTAYSTDHYKIFSILGLSAVYYPVIVQLERKNLLDKILPEKQISILKMVEIIDVRVLKVRDYAGKKDLASFAYRLNNFNQDLKEIETSLLWFNSYQISDDRFKDYLSSYDYSKNTGLLRLIFIDYCERLKKKTFTIEELKKIMQEDPTIEHILSQSPRFKPKAFGFKNDEDFENEKNLIGNLTILEKKINSSIQNIDLAEKHKGYSTSRFKMTNLIGTTLAANGGNFKKADMHARAQDLIGNFVIRWWAH